MMWPVASRNHGSSQVLKRILVWLLTRLYAVFCQMGRYEPQLFNTLYRFNHPEEKRPEMVSQLCVYQLQPCCRLFYNSTQRGVLAFNRVVVMLTFCLEVRIRICPVPF